MSVGDRELWVQDHARSPQGQTRLPLSGLVRAIGPLLVWGGAAAAAMVAVVAADRLPGVLFVSLVLACTLGAFGVVAVRAFPRAAIVVTLGTLLLLGMFRRTFDYLVGVTAEDPLLFVGPAVALILVMQAMQGGSLRADTVLSRVVLGVMLLSLAWALNPLADGPLAGVVALLFFTAPLLWFWIGRAYGDEKLMPRVTTLLMFAGTFAAIYVLWQSFNGFPAWDQHWIANRGSAIASLSLEGETRPFGPSSNAAESTMVVLFGVAALVLSKGRIPVLLRCTLVPVAAIALLAVGSRGPIVGLALLLAVGPLWHRGLGGVVLGIVVAMVVLVGLTSVAQGIDPEDHDERIRPGLRHVTSGLAEPFDESEGTSTLPTHLQMVNAGLRSPLEAPLGSGPQSVTLAGSRLGGGSANAEHDTGNVARALGLPGVALYLALVVAVARAAWSARRSLDARGAALVAAGVLIISFGQWFNGGMYGASAVAWFYIGYLDRTGPLRALDGEARELVVGADGGSDRSRAEREALR